MVKKKCSPANKCIVHVVVLLMTLLQLQCRSHDFQVVQSGNNEKEFAPTLVIDSCMVERQYEGKDSTILVRVKITGENKTIPQWAFAVVSSLEEVKLDCQIKTIEDNAFFSCKKLGRINLNDIYTIGENSFKNSAIEKVDLSHANTIKDFAFANCMALRDVVFSDKLETIGDFAFSGDTSLVSCHVPAGNIGVGAFMGCSKLEDISFGNVVSIGESSFLDCTSLTKVVIPATVKSIGKDAFAGCISLKQVVIESEDTTIADGAFENTVIITKNNSKYE